MGIIDSLGETSEKAADKGQHYVDTTKAYLRLKIFQQVCIIVGSMGKAMVVGGMAFIGFLFVAVALAIGLGNLFGSMVLGCLGVALIFFILGFIAFRFRNHIDTEIIKKMAPKFFEST